MLLLLKMRQIAYASRTMRGDTGEALRHHVSAKRAATQQFALKK